MAIVSSKRRCTQAPRQRPLNAPGRRTSLPNGGVVLSARRLRSLGGLISTIELTCTECEMEFLCSTSLHLSFMFRSRLKLNGRRFHAKFSGEIELAHNNTPIQISALILVWTQNWCKILHRFMPCHFI